MALCPPAAACGRQLNIDQSPAMRNCRYRYFTTGNHTALACPGPNATLWVAGL